MTRYRTSNNPNHGWTPECEYFAENQPNRFQWYTGGQLLNSPSRLMHNVPGYCPAQV
jgi:hypothetical protein